jgi:hypothetical protein
MRVLFATLSAIAVGVLLIAYALLSPRAPAGDLAFSGDTARQAVQPVGMTDRVDWSANDLDLTCEPGQRALVRQVGGRTAAACVGAADAVGAERAATMMYPASYSPPYASNVPRKVSSRTLASTVREPRPSAHSNNWKRDALLIGGSAAAGAGVGALVGGTKGALVGAALGGGGTALYKAFKH